MLYQEMIKILVNNKLIDVHILSVLSHTKIKVYMNIEYGQLHQC